MSDSTSDAVQLLKYIEAYRADYDSYGRATFVAADEWLEAGRNNAPRTYQRFQWCLFPEVEEGFDP